jgi:P4 family phage/plasmid primase-like protien
MNNSRTKFNNTSDDSQAHGIRSSRSDTSWKESDNGKQTIIPAGRAWRLLAQYFLGQVLSDDDRDVLKADAIYGRWLHHIDNHPGGTDLANWCQTAGMPQDQQQHFTDMVEFEHNLQQQLQAWEDEAVRSQGDSPRRIAGSIVYEQAQTHGGPTILYCRQGYWSYGPEPCWEQYPSWVDRELPRLTNCYVDAWNAEKIAEAEAINQANWEAYQNSLSTSKPLQVPKTVVAPTVSDHKASKLTGEVLKQLKPHITAGKGTPPTGPFWINPGPLDPDPSRIIPLSNGLLDISDPSRPVLLPHTARFFSPNLLPFPYDPNWPYPKRFMGILEDQFGKTGDKDEDVQSKNALLEYLALTLIPELKYQKFLILLGEPGTGRSTLMDCFIEVLGERNHGSIEVQALSSAHGKAGLIDKLLITFNDSRVADAQDTTTALQFLLQLVGGDKQHIDPKYKDTLTAKLLARAIMICNILPNFRDITSGIERRILVVWFQRKILNPNPNLAQEIKEYERPGILNVLLKHLSELQTRGHFIQPQRSQECIDEMRESASNLFGYLQECCQEGDCEEESDRVLARDAYQVYKLYIKQTGTRPLSLTEFRNKLPIAADRIWDNGLRQGRPWIEPQDGGTRKRGPSQFYGLIINDGLLRRAHGAATYGIIE